MDSPAIQVVNLKKRYENARAHAVDGVSFDVAPGEFFALLGPNGAGKTTTISILTTTLRPTAGRARVGGHDVRDDPAGVRRSAGIIFQHPSLDRNLTAEENVRFHAVLYGLYPFRPTFRTMPRVYREDVRMLADVLGIADDMFRPIHTFSGGMKRKLEILRSLVHRPRVLFLDEPTTGLDASSRRSLWQYLDTVRRDDGTTLFLTTHYIEEAERADRICIISNGRVVALGSPEDVKAQLVDRYVVIDAEDRDSLASELDRKEIRYERDRSFRLPVAGPDVHRVLRSIETPLTRVETHAPSLEDAYLEIVERPADELEALDA